jgi:hypothetical protein
VVGEVVFDYSPEDLAIQGLFPLDGAEIVVLPLTRLRCGLVWTCGILDEAIRDGLMQPGPFTVEKLGGWATGDPKRDLIRLSFTTSYIDGAPRIDTIVYVTVDRLPLRIMLLRWEQDRNLRAHRAAFLAVLNSLRAASQGPDAGQPKERARPVR